MEVRLRIQPLAIDCFALRATLERVFLNGSFGQQAEVFSWRVSDRYFQSGHFWHLKKLCYILVADLRRIWTNWRGVNHHQGEGQGKPNKEVRKGVISGDVLNRLCSTNSSKRITPNFSYKISNPVTTDAASLHAIYRLFFLYSGDIGFW